MNSDAAILLRLLDESFGRRAWHGTNLRGSIRGITAERAAWRPGPGRHNIWEIVVHAAYWKYAVRRKLSEGPRGSFAYPGSNWFARPGKDAGSSWKSDAALLGEEHRLLCDTLKAIRPDRLKERSGGKAWTLAELVMGVAFHDIYHAGQIQLIKRLFRK